MMKTPPAPDPQPTLVSLRPRLRIRFVGRISLREAANPGLVTVISEDRKVH